MVREYTAIREIEVEIILLSIIAQRLMDTQEEEGDFRGITTGGIAGKV